MLKEKEAEYVKYIDPITSSLITALTPSSVYEKLLKENKDSPKRISYEEAMAANLNHLIPGLNLLKEKITIPVKESGNQNQIKQAEDSAQAILDPLGLVLTENQKHIFWITNQTSQTTAEAVPRGYVLLENDLTKAQLNTATKDKYECIIPIPLAILTANRLKVLPQPSESTSSPINSQELAILFKTPNHIPKIKKVFLAKPKESKQEQVVIICSPDDKEYINSFFLTTKLSKAEAVALHYASTERLSAPPLDITADALATAVNMLKVPCGVRQIDDHFTITYAKANANAITQFKKQNSIIFEKNLLAALRFSIKSESTGDITETELNKYLIDGKFKIIGQTVIATDANIDKLNVFKGEKIPFDKYLPLFAIKAEKGQKPVDLVKAYLKDNKLIPSEFEILAAAGVGRGSGAIDFYIPQALAGQVILGLDNYAKSHKISLTVGITEDLLRAATKRSKSSPSKDWQTALHILQDEKIIGPVWISPDETFLLIEDTKQITGLAPQTAFAVDHIHHLAIEAKAACNDCKETDFIQQCKALGITLTIQYKSKMFGHYEGIVKIIEGLDKWKEIMQSTLLITSKSDKLFQKDPSYRSKKVPDKTLDQAFTKTEDRTSGKEYYITPSSIAERARNTMIRPFAAQNDSKQEKEWVKWAKEFFEFDKSKNIKQPEEIKLDTLPEYQQLVRPVRADKGRPYAGRLLMEGATASQSSTSTLSSSLSPSSGTGTRGI